MAEYEYTGKEDHDTELFFCDMLYHINKDTGEIKEIRYHNTKLTE